MRFRSGRNSGRGELPKYLGGEYQEVRLVRIISDMIHADAGYSSSLPRFERATHTLELGERGLPLMRARVATAESGAHTGFLPPLSLEPRRLKSQGCHYRGTTYTAEDRECVVGKQLLPARGVAIPLRSRAV